MHDVPRPSPFTLILCFAGLGADGLLALGLFGAAAIGEIVLALGRMRQE